MNFATVTVFLEAYLRRLGSMIPLGTVVFREAVGTAMDTLDETEAG
jgi:hypothetical protein